MNGEGWGSSRLKLLRKQEDRDVYTVGSGRLVVYRGAIADPSEFAMDVIDVVTQKRRPARLWNAPSVVALAAGKGILKCVNYGSPVSSEVQAHLWEVLESHLAAPRSPAAYVEDGAARRHHGGADS